MGHKKRNNLLLHVKSITESIIYGTFFCAFLSRFFRRAQKGPKWSKASRLTILDPFGPL